MSDSRGRYALANSTSGEYVSRSVPTIEEAQHLLETVYGRDCGEIVICDIWSREPLLKPKVSADAAGSDCSHILDNGDNSPG